MSEQPQSGDGLVLPEAFPVKSSSMNVETVRAAAGSFFARTFAGTGIGAGTLSAAWQTATVAETTVATHIHQAFDTHGHFAAQITFYFIFGNLFA